MLLPLGAGERVRGGRVERLVSSAEQGRDDFFWSMPEGWQAILQNRGRLEKNKAMKLITWNISGAAGLTGGSISNAA